MTALVGDSLGKRYGGRRVITAASLRAESGRVTALVGRNGAGKSTLLGICAGWLRPDHGFVRLGDETFLRPRLHLLARRGLFFLPDRNLLSPGVPVGRQLRIVAVRFGSEDELPAVAERLGIGAVLDSPAQALSGGETRRAEVAAALLRRPRFLLADEPFRGIAPGDIEVLARAFRELAAAGAAVVVSGHEVPSLFSLADSVVWCTDGTTYSFPTPQAAEADWRFRRGYLGTAWSEARALAEPDG